MTDPNKICLGCMHVTEDPEGTCPLCGFQKKKYNQMRSYRGLPLMTILQGRYMTGKILGEGGFGITYLAWDLLLEIPVAVKEYFPSQLATRDTRTGTTATVSIISKKHTHYYEKGMTDFEEEARNLAKFQNLRGVVKVKDFFLENQTAYLVMEYIDGISLKKYMERKNRPLPQEKVLKIMKPVLDSLALIHEKGIIHRDISPDNILITRKGEVKLIDFGAARMTAGAETKTMTILLKRGYAPLEQYQTRGRQGPWTDIYAICATMYHMLSGVIPEEATERTPEDSLQSLEELAQKIPGMKVSPSVSEVIAKGLRPQPQDRYQRVGQLIQDLYQEENRDPIRMKTEGPVTWENPPTSGKSSSAKQLIPVIGALAVVGIVSAIMIGKKLYEDYFPANVSAEVQEPVEVRENIEISYYQDSSADALMSDIEWQEPDGKVFETDYENGNSHLEGEEGYLDIYWQENDKIWGVDVKGYPYISVYSITVGESLSSASSRLTYEGFYYEEETDYWRKESDSDIKIQIAGEEKVEEIYLLFPYEDVIL